MFKNYFVLLFAIICVFNQVFAGTIKDGFAVGTSSRESETASAGHTLGNSFRESTNSGAALSGTSSRESTNSGAALSGTSSRESTSSGTAFSGTSSRESTNSGAALSGTSSRESTNSGAALSGTSSRESTNSGAALSGTSSRESTDSGAALSGTSSRESTNSGAALSGSSTRTKRSADSIQTGYSAGNSLRTDEHVQTGYAVGNKPREGLTKQAGYAIGFTARDSSVIYDNLKDVPLIQPKGSLFDKDNFASIPVDKVEFEKSSMKVKRDTQSNTEQPLLKDAVDAVDDENTNKSSIETTVAPKEEKQFYMCLIYCSCGCIDTHCCSGCKPCTNDQLNSLFLSNTNPSDSTNQSAEITTLSPPS